MIAKDRLDESDIRPATALLSEAGLPVLEQTWVEPGSAYDLRLSAEPAVVRAALARLGEIDLVVQPTAGRGKRLLVADMDSTMITVECIDELADYAGLKAEVAAITEQAMQGELDFEDALEARVALLVGLEEAVLDQCRKERVRITPGAKTLVRTMKARGATCVLVSGGFSHFAKPIAQEIGFDYAVANRLGIAFGRLTGKTKGAIVNSVSKRDLLLAERHEYQLTIQETLAVGDGANDIPMLQAAGLGVAYHAKPAARSAADATIDHNDLTALLYAQGIKRSDWVEN